MSALLRLSALRMQELHVLQTECASCGHTLKLHPTTTRHKGNPCAEWHIVNGHQKFCKCRDWVDPSEQLDLAGNEVVDD